MAAPVFPNNPKRRRYISHVNMPPTPNATVQYYGWAPEPIRLLSVKVYMENVNTQGTYVFTLTNEETGATMLSAASFNMNTLTDDTITEVPVTGTIANKRLPTEGRWTIALTSNNAAFDGSGIYIELIFEGS